MTRLVIHDDFQGYHGANVAACAKRQYSGPIALIDNQGSNINFATLFSSLESLGASTRVFNLSFGASMGYADSLGEGVRQSDVGNPANPMTVIYDHLKRAYDKNVSLVFPASQKSPKANTIHPYAVNFMATSGYSIVVGADADYSNSHPGFIDYMVDGCYTGPNSGCGTSYSTPRLSGAIARLQEQNGDTLTHAQVRSALDNASIYIQYDGNNHAHPNLNDVRKVGITDRLKAQALYRVYLNRNPSESEVVSTMAQMAFKSIEALATEFKSRKEAQVPYDRVTPAQRICSLFHLFVNREPTNFELSISLHYLNETHDSIRNQSPCFKIEWGGYYVEFLNYMHGRGEAISKEFLF